MVDVGVFGTVTARSTSRSNAASNGAPVSPLHLGALDAEERDELALLVDLRERERSRDELRRRLKGQMFDGRITVLAHVWLVDHAIQHALFQRCAQTGDTATFAAAIDANRHSINITVGQCPTGGADWSAMDAARPVRDAARALFEQLRRAIARTVDDAVDSGLVETAADSPFPMPTDGGVEVRLVDADPISRSRVETFIAEVERLGQIAEEVTLRLRFEALRCRHGSPRTWRERRAMRTREALASLDTMRAMHAAIAEVDAACAITWSSHVIVDHTILSLSPPQQ